MRKVIYLTLMFLLSMPITVSYGQTQTASPVEDAIMARRSIRKYKDIPVEREKLMKIAMCGINAPNASNRQNWEVRIVDSKKWIDKCTKAYVATIKGTEQESRILNKNFRNMFRNAAAVIFVAARPGRFAGVDCGMMGQNMMLEAYELGLGTCCLGSPAKFLKSEEGKPFFESLGFSEGFKFQYALAVGYPDEAPDAKPRDASKIKFVE